MRTSGVCRVISYNISKQKSAVTRCFDCGIDNLVYNQFRNSSSLVHKLKRQFFPEEFAPTVQKLDENVDFGSESSQDPTANDYVPPKNIDEQIRTLYQVDIK